MTGFLNICLQIPNISSLLFIIVFIFAIPFFLYKINSIDLLKLYTPFVVMLAITLTQSGTPDVFNNLYQIDPNTLESFIMTNMINLFGIIGILWYCIGIALHYQNITLGIIVGCIAFAITFPIAREAIPYLINNGHRVLIENTKFSYPYNWDKYMIGFISIFGLLTIYYILNTIIVDTFQKGF